MPTPYFQNQWVTLYEGDCLEIMPRLERNIDAVIADPPYGEIACSWDSIIQYPPMWDEINRLLKINGVCALFSAQPFETDLINSNRAAFKYELIWEKNSPTGMNQSRYRPMRYHENILIFNATTHSTFNPQRMPRTQPRKESYRYLHACCKSNHVTNKHVPYHYDPDTVLPGTILKFPCVSNRKGKLHPTQKPVALLEWLIKTYTNPGETILDFCAGAGSLGEACINTNRKCILIEQDPKYCEIIKNRLQPELMFACK